MRIDKQSFFQKSAQCFFEFRTLCLQVINNKQALSLEFTDDGFIEINVQNEPLEYTSLFGNSRVPHASLNDGFLSNLFSPYAINLKKIVILSKDFFYFPKYSWSLADFFVRNTAFYFLAGKRDIYFLNIQQNLTSKQMELASEFLRFMYFEYRKSFCSTYDKSENSFPLYKIINAPFCSGELFDVEFLDNEVLSLNHFLLPQYENNFEVTIVDDLLSMRKDILKVKFG